ncbi:PAS/PAC sensor signal transduction histidine kinase [Rubrobacter xylanophilus DSM 9941]|uniref:Sensor-like histidine kinase SenX3 n=1 Tax=Rubrobacter xylanophilus (strain DSM 9941 / JCM 11954 / NBRC 16129 / PRD-1) TaxID=266117 RepID=Q1AZU6_RUBXD|nr:PAS domain S-box protein [Rubrobacter xylanophilus]ABG03082.1 PAS/PAC sensor signal transduction histidine kinase [Rubrobacter xylanophilus DSM 9941]
MDPSSLQGYQPLVFYAAAAVAGALLAGLAALLLWRRGRPSRRRDALRAAAFEQAAEGMLLVSGDRVLEANAACAALLGRERGELAGMPLGELLAGGAGGVPLPPGKRSWSGTLALRSGGGEPVECEAAASRVLAGGREAVCLALRDVTERRREEEKLRETESRYRTLVEQVPAIVYIEDVQTQATLYDSPRIEEILGYPRDLCEREPLYWHRILYPEDRERVLEAEREAVERGSFVLEYRVFAADGRVVWVRDEARLLRDESGEPRFWQGVISDITEQRRAEDALRESEERYRSLVQLSPDGVAVESEGRFVYLNEAGARLLGASSPQEVLGQPVMERVHPDCRENARRRARRLRRGERVELQEERWLRLDGREMDVEVSAAPVQYGGRPSAQLVLRDVTGRKRAEREIVRQKAELARSNAELEQFAYLIAHDLRAPLRSMDGFAQILLEDCAPRLGPDGREYLARIQRATRKMARMIDELLGLSRLARADIRREPVDLSAMARSIGEELRQGEPDRRVEFIVAGGLAAEGDRRLLRVALANLLENAWKFTRRTPRPRIVFGRIERGGERVFFVRDNGVGFDMAYAGKLFGPFQRLHAEEEFEGTGIGLAAVARVIERHGGRVWAEGAEGEGATFYFTL